MLGPSEGEFDDTKTDAGRRLEYLLWSAKIHEAQIANNT